MVGRCTSHCPRNQEPLTPIQLSAERIKRRFGKQIDDNDRAIFDQCTDTIVRQVGDIGRMVDEFSAFARMPKPTKERSDLRDVLKDATFLREMGASHVTFATQLGDAPWRACSIRACLDKHSAILSRMRRRLSKHRCRRRTRGPHSGPRGFRRGEQPVRSGRHRQWQGPACREPPPHSRTLYDDAG